jgi:hypothetical protein
MRLSEWDEVAYIFPASPELVNGETVIACGGPITEEAPMAQYVKAGSGWPLTGGAGSTLDLGYVFGQLTSALPAATAKAEIIRALSEWVKNSNIRFSPVQNTAGPRTINIFFGSRSHGDAYPFDGPGGALGHTFYPAPMNSEPIAGDMHLDAEETWRVGASIDLYSVTLHEAGHALGLAHSDQPSAVMYPFYKMSTSLSADDISGIQALYGPPSAEQGGGTPAPVPSPALSIAVASPAANVTTTATTVSAAGTASGGSGTLHITWTNDRGGSGAASGAANWTVASLALSAGANHITFTVTDGAGKTASQTVLVTRNDPLPQPDRIAPTLQILSPGSTLISTSAAAFSLNGTAADNVGVVVVRWTNTYGGGGAASGTANWQAANVPLLVGTNKITVTAFDAAGNSAGKTITVVRR